MESGFLCPPEYSLVTMQTTLFWLMTCPYSTHRKEDIFIQILVTHKPSRATPRNSVWSQQSLSWATNFPTLIETIRSLQASYLSLSRAWVTQFTSSYLIYLRLNIKCNIAWQSRPKCSTWLLPYRFSDYSVLQNASIIHSHPHSIEKIAFLEALSSSFCINTSLSIPATCPVYFKLIYAQQRTREEYFIIKGPVICTFCLLPGHRIASSNSCSANRQFTFVRSALSECVNKT
jgi:hypothetical protein